MGEFSLLSEEQFVSLPVMLLSVHLVLALLQSGLRQRKGSTGLRQEAQSILDF